MIKKVLIVILCSLCLILGIPILIDWCVFGNSFPSNVNNETWAAFLGSYIGGIATLAAVFINIVCNNKKIEEQNRLETERRMEEKKFVIKPYLTTQLNMFNEIVDFGLNDRIFDVTGREVEKVRYGFNSEDINCIRIRQSVSRYFYLKYTIRNVGAGSAVNMKICVNGFPSKMAIAKDEIVNIYLLINMKNENEISINIDLDYWDVENRAHYNQSEEFMISVNGELQTIKPGLIVPQREILSNT